MKLCSKLEVSLQFSQLCWKMTLKNGFIFNIEEKILTFYYSIESGDVRSDLELKIN